MRTVTFVGLLSAGLLTYNAEAASVNYHLEYDETAGTFQLFASASADDNAGIACYGVALQGPITALSHVSPCDPSAANTAQQYGAAGFSLLRSPNGGDSVFASQDTITPTPHLIYGLGQSSGSFSQHGLTAGAAAKSTNWDGRLLLATGTFDSNVGLPSIDYGSLNTLANVFKSAGSPETISASILGKPLPSPPVTPPIAPVEQPLPPIADPSVRYRIEFSDVPGNFKLFASASADGHAGIALYGVELTGPVTSVSHVSPATAGAQNSANDFGVSGFTLFRSDDGDTSLFGAQDTITATPHLLYGIGQQAGSFAESGIIPLAAADGAEWGAEVLLAIGTFDATLGSLGIDYDNTFANVFQSLGGTSTKSARIIEDPALITVPPSVGTPPFAGPVDPAPTELPSVIPPAGELPELEIPPPSIPPVAERTPAGEETPNEQPEVELTVDPPADPPASGIAELIDRGVIDVNELIWRRPYIPADPGEITNIDAEIFLPGQIGLARPLVFKGMPSADLAELTFRGRELLLGDFVTNPLLFTPSPDGITATASGSASLRFSSALINDLARQAAQTPLPEPASIVGALVGMFALVLRRRFTSAQ